MDRKAYALACFKVTQRLRLEGKIPPSQSCEHALARGDALAMLGLSIASAHRARRAAYGTPRHKAAETRVKSRADRLRLTFGCAVNLSYDNPFFPQHPALAFCPNGGAEKVEFEIPNPDNF